MRTITKMGVALALVVALAGAALAGDFSPEMSFELTDTKVKANPEIKITVAQDEGEEELAHVTLRIPKGFNLPRDEQIEDGTQLGTANISIDVGPRCNGYTGSFAVPFNNKQIYEQDRTDDQADSNVVAVWVVDLQPVTSIPLEVTGSKKKGWQLDGDIPANAWTCPPLSFEATIASTAGDVPILTNPKKPGKYVFSGSFDTQDSPQTATIEQVITITK